MSNRDTRKAINLDATGLFLAGLSNTFLALAVAVLIHGPGTVSSQPDLMLRASWIADHPQLWKAGWLFWFVPTLSFCWSYYALGRHLNAASQWGKMAIGAALIAAAVDVVGVFVNLTVLPELAQMLAQAAITPEPSLQILFRAMENLANNLTNVGGYGLYTVAGLLLLPALFATRSYPRWLAWLGVVEWGISTIAVAMLIIDPDLATVPLLVSFVLYAPWVWGSAVWLLRHRPAASRSSSTATTL